MSEESTGKKEANEQPVEKAVEEIEDLEESVDEPPEKSVPKSKKRSFIGSKSTHLTKKELKELQKNLEETRERIKQLEKQLAEQSAKADENYDNYLRLHAETENFRKRIQREVAESIKYATESLIIEILPALNNFETALLAAEKIPETKNFAIGMEMILKQLMDALKAKGVEQIVPEHEAFDPKLHSAVEKIETNEYTEDHIVEVIQKGFKLHDRVVQPASVKVAVPLAGSEAKEKTTAHKEDNSQKIPVEDPDELNKGKKEK